MINLTLTDPTVEYHSTKPMLQPTLSAILPQLDSPPSFRSVILHTLNCINMTPTTGLKPTTSRLVVLHTTNCTNMPPTMLFNPSTSRMVVLNITNCTNMSPTI